MSQKSVSESQKSIAIEPTPEKILEIPLAELAGVEKQAFRDAMSHLGSAVNIITTAGEAGRAGFTASAVCSVTDSPPTLLVCLNRSASVYPIFQQNQVLCVNTLSDSHEALSNLFGGKTPMEERFAAANWTAMASGSPALQGALTSFDCRVSQVTSVGTHDVMFCEVIDILRNDDSHGLVYFDRRYHPLIRQKTRT